MTRDADRIVAAIDNLANIVAEHGRSFTEAVAVLSVTLASLRRCDDDEQGPPAPENGDLGGGPGHDDDLS